MFDIIAFFLFTESKVRTMSKYNTKSIPEMAVNEMGELAYVMSEKENLVSSVLTTFMTRSYYETMDLTDFSLLYVKYL